MSDQQPDTVTAHSFTEENVAQLAEAMLGEEDAREGAYGWYAAKAAARAVLASGVVVPRELLVNLAAEWTRPGRNICTDSDGERYMVVPGGAQYAAELLALAGGAS